MTSTEITVPGPEPGWGRAFDLVEHGGNPASQGFLWDAAKATFREVAVLAATFDAVAGRLRLHTESVTEDLGEVDAATFQLGNLWYAISRFHGYDANGLQVWIDSDALVDDDEAVARLLAALDVPADIVGYRCDGAGTFFTEADPTPLDRFAGRVRRTLLAAGLPVVPDHTARAGARIDLDRESALGGSVSVVWQAHPRLRTEPATGHYLLAQQAMADAMATILTSAGFTTVARSGRLLLGQALEEATGPVDGQSEERWGWAVFGTQVTQPREADSR